MNKRFTADMNEESSANDPDESEETDGVNKRFAASLTLSCGVCSAPAPDHMHFGGRQKE